MINKNQTKKKVKNLLDTIKTIISYERTIL